jgi:hypothetical protein
VSYYTLIAPELPIDLSSHGREWESHLQRFIAEEMASTGTQTRTESPSDEVPFHHVRLTPSGSLGSGSLLMIPLVGNKLALVIETFDVPSQEHLDLWRTVYERATAAVGATATSLDWLAVVSCTDSWYTPQELDEPAVLGGLALQPSGASYTFVADGGRPSLSGWQPRTSYPVVVAGTSSGYDHESAMREASKELHLVACLMTCSWGSTWGALEAPRPAESGEMSVPRNPPWHRRDPDDLIDQIDIQHDHVTITPTMAGAWDILNRDSIVRNAASAFKEATELHRSHASFALVAYVASIEGVGQKFKKPRRCPECKMILESTSRFIQAAERVGLPEDADIIGQIARLRGTTAHQGVLHGTEATVGAWYGPSFFQNEPALDFERSLHAMRRIARNLLSEQLGLTEAS